MPLKVLSLSVAVVVMPRGCMQTPSLCSCSSLTVPPSIKDQNGESLSVLNVREGSSVSLECESNAIPAPSITWYKNGRALAGSPHLDILAEGQMLHIRKVEVRLLFPGWEDWARAESRGSAGLQCENEFIENYHSQGQRDGSEVTLCVLKASCMVPRELLRVVLEPSWVWPKPLNIPQNEINILKTIDF